jgi:hypothetical protein
MIRQCNVCHKEYHAKPADVARGWALHCSKSCAIKGRDLSRRPIKIAAKNFKILLEKFGQQVSFPAEVPKSAKEKFYVNCSLHGKVETSIAKLLNNKMACWKCGKKCQVIIDGKKECADCKIKKDIKEYRIQRNRTRPVCIECDRKRDIERTKKRDKAKVRVNSYKSVSKKKEANGIYKKTDIIIKECEYCKILKVYKGTVGKRFCKSECGKLFTAKLRLGTKYNRPEKEYNCRKCNNIFMSNHPGTCNECKKECNKIAHKAYNKKRRAAVRTIAIQSIIDNKVFERDNWKCKNCKCKVQKMDIYRNDAAELDHIVPISLGGPHSYSNVQTLCRQCNQQKSNNYNGQLVMAI